MKYLLLLTLIACGAASEAREAAVEKLRGSSYDRCVRQAIESCDALDSLTVAGYECLEIVNRGCLRGFR